MPPLFFLRKLATMMLVVCGFLVFLASTTKADTFNFSFVGTTSEPAPANAAATVTGSAGGNLLTVTLTNNLNNIVTRGSAISGFSFQVRQNGVAINITPTIVSQSGRLVTFNDSTPNNTSAADVGVNGSAVDTLRWRATGGGRLLLNGLGITGSGTNPPDELIIGPPTTGMIWASANGSITISDPAQPFVNTTAVFTVNIGSILQSGFQITNVQMLFGTSGATLGGTTITQVPEPASMLLLGTGLVGVATGIRRRRNARK